MEVPALPTCHTCGPVVWLSPLTLKRPHTHTTSNLAALSLLHGGRHEGQIIQSKPCPSLIITGQTHAASPLTDHNRLPATGPQTNRLRGSKQAEPPFNGRQQRRTADEQGPDSGIQQRRGPQQRLKQDRDCDTARSRNCRACRQATDSA